MSTKQPVLLVVLVQTSRMRWLVAGLDFEHNVFPLLVSDDDDLASYRGLGFDEQTSFLRHRFCGVLQRGSDRLWGLQKKARQFVFLMDHPFPADDSTLSSAVAENLVQWMTSPPVAFLVGDSEFDNVPDTLTPLAGELSAEHLETLTAGLPRLIQEVASADHWEHVPPPRSSTT